MKHSPSKMPLIPLQTPLWLESVDANERAAARVSARRRFRLLCLLVTIFAGMVAGWLAWAVPAVKRLMND